MQNEETRLRHGWGRGSFFPSTETKPNGQRTERPPPNPPNRTNEQHRTDTPFRNIHVRHHFTAVHTLSFLSFVSTIIFYDFPAIPFVLVSVVFYTSIRCDLVSNTPILSLSLPSIHHCHLNYLLERACVCVIDIDITEGGVIKYKSGKCAAW